MLERQLTQGIYGEEFKPNIGPFGLSTGQIRAERGFGHNAGWYNSQGERLGWGDLSPQDATRIRDEIPVDEVFITLDEHCAFWHFATGKIGFNGSMTETDEKIDNPGIRYVAKWARYIIGRGIVYEVESKDGIHWGVGVVGLSRQGAVSLLTPPSFFKKFRTMFGMHRKNW